MSTTFDPVMRDLDQHLADEEIAESREQAIEDYAEHLTKHGAEYYPYQPKLISEAIGEADDAFFAKLGDALGDGTPQRIAELMRGMIGGYWYAIALKAAEEKVDADRAENIRTRGAA